MRKLLLALLTLTLFAACEPIPPQTQPEPERVQRVQPQVQPAQAEEAVPEEAVDIEAELPEVEAEPEEVLPPPDPPMLAQQRAACTREGGQLSSRGQGLFACVRPTSDGGTQCDAASACQGVCLARSRTCAPFEPMFGCQEVFTLPGRRETVCID